MRDIHDILRNEKVKGNLQSNRYNINQFLKHKNHYTHIHLPPKKGMERNTPTCVISGNWGRKKPFLIYFYIPLQLE